ncbi:MAG: hypothetical protein OEZ39_05550 [Gammaproteobacteria bacterium]|nr:hypothetical protein [Gammaproteobacteria bacterium]MDH5651320.1 hypothetical protein [Gammaproteobacteria bacterium]
MSIYYCHECAAQIGMLGSPPIGDDLADNSYKLEKYLKHTIPNSYANYKTVFTGVTSKSYQNYIVTAVSSGHVQIDDSNRINIVWVGSDSTGIALEAGKYIGEMSAVKVVCYSDTNKIHGYPIKVSELNAASCAQCGKPIPY